MTTLIGIKTDDGRIVLGSDITATSTEEIRTAESIHFIKSQGELQKIYVSENQKFAIGVTGTFDKAYRTFLREILVNEDIMEKRLEKGFFPELQKMNLGRWDLKYPTDDTCSLMIGANFKEKPELYGCHCLGKIEKLGLWTDGSGKKYANQYLQHHMKDYPIAKEHMINTQEGIDMVVQGLGNASRDLYTGGVDIVIIEKDKIIEHSKEIDKHYRESSKALLKKIKKTYK